MSAQKKTGKIKVVIPARHDHGGFDSMVIEINDYHSCGAKTIVKDSLSFDGSRRLKVHEWQCENGHIGEQYEVIRKLIEKGEWK